MSGIFELVATLCIGAICADHVLPAPDAMTRAVCESGAGEMIDGWLARHDGYAAAGHSCQPLAALAGQAAEVSETAPGHFVHFGKVEDLRPGSSGDIANTGFVIGADAVAVIDAGTTRTVAEALYLAVRQRTDLPIRWLALTHMHPDHSLGAEVFREAGARIVGHGALDRALASRAGIYMANMARLLGPEVMHATHVIGPDAAIDGTGEIDLGGRVLQLATHPTAHTDNDMTVFDAGSKTLWTGDLVFLEHTPALDGSINGWIAVLQAMPQTEAQAIVPGHGRMLAAHPDGLRPTLDYLFALRDQTRAAIAAGEGLNEAITHLGMDLADGWAMFGAFNPRNATNAYVELEWE